MCAKKAKGSSSIKCYKSELIRSGLPNLGIIHLSDLESFSKAGKSVKLYILRLDFESFLGFYSTRSVDFVF